MSKGKDLTVVKAVKWFRLIEANIGKGTQQTKDAIAHS